MSYPFTRYRVPLRTRLVVWCARHELTINLLLAAAAGMAAGSFFSWLWL